MTSAPLCGALFAQQLNTSRLAVNGQTTSSMSVNRGVRRTRLVPIEHSTAMKSDQTPDIEAVRDAVAASLPNGPSLSRIAKTFGTSGRSLQRLMASQGIRFSDIVADVRQEMARELLVDTSATVHEIAARLGYRETSSFTRAFIRHANISPATFRRKLRGARK